MDTKLDTSLGTSMEFFDFQMTRLKNEFGVKAFGDERISMIWKRMKNVSEYICAAIVDDFIASMRSAPLPSDFFKAIDEYREREKIEMLSVKPVTQFQTAVEILDEAAKRDKGEFAKQCVKLVRDYNAKKITKEQFLQGCDYLDEAANLSMRKKKCPDCNGEGYVYPRDNEGYSFLKRCHCLNGDLKPQAILGPKRLDGEREEISVPRHRKIS